MNPKCCRDISLGDICLDRRFSCLLQLPYNSSQYNSLQMTFRMTRDQLLPDRRAREARVTSRQIPSDGTETYDLGI